MTLINLILERFYEFLILTMNNPESINFAKSQNEKNAKFLLEFLVESDEKKICKKKMFKAS